MTQSLSRVCNNTKTTTYRALGKLRQMEFKRYKRLTLFVNNFSQSSCRELEWNDLRQMSQ